MLEVKLENETVFGVYENGEVLLMVDKEKLVKSLELLTEATTYLKSWISRKYSIVSTESETDQLKPENQQCHACPDK
jgi:hypothetical protein